MLGELLQPIGNFVLIAIGLYVLLKSSDLFVESASKIARRIGVRESVIGLTIVALGTSFPELVASVIAASTGSYELIVGNVLGSNIANHGLILGVVAVFTPYTLKKHLFGRDAALVVGLAIATLILMIAGPANRTVGVALLGAYIIYTIYVIKTHREEGEELEKLEEVPLRGTATQDATIVILAILGLWLGGELAIQNAITLSRLIGLPELVIAATIIAVGTSLPELSVCLAAARSGKGDLIAGNVLGSSIANILLVLGVSSLVTTIYFDQRAILLGCAWLMLAIFTAWYVHKREHIKQKHGAVLFGIFAFVSLMQIIW